VSAVALLAKHAVGGSAPTQTLTLLDGATHTFVSWAAFACDVTAAVPAFQGLHPNRLACSSRFK
jgi:hypothetical protein